MTQSQETITYPLAYDRALDAPDDWERLREQCPVAGVALPSGDHAKLLTRHQDVKGLLSDARFARPTAQDGSARIAPDGVGGSAVTGTTKEYSLPATGEPHRQWRRQVSKWFTAKRMNALRPAMTTTAEGLVDAMVAHGEPADLKAEFGFLLPVYVICDMLGVPANDHHRFSHWSDAMLSTTRFTQEEIDRAHTEFVDYMSSHVAARREHSVDDLISMLIQDSEGEGIGLTDKELVATSMGLLVAGHETTANMIGKMIAMLLADRSRWEEVLTDPSLVRTTVEEALRFDTNLGFGMRRFLTEDIEIDGESLPSGTTVICSQAAANRDTTVFEDPDEMDLSRSPNPHLAFGAGPHSCLGQALARTELQVALEVLLRRLPTLELAVAADDLDRVSGLLVGGLEQVPVRW